MAGAGARAMQVAKLEDRAPGRVPDTWLVTMVIVGKSPKDRVGLDPFQMANVHGL